MKIPNHILVALTGVHKDEINGLKDMLDDKEPKLKIKITRIDAYKNEQELSISRFANLEQFLFIAWNLESSYWKWKDVYI